MITGDDRWYQVALLLLNAVQAALTVPVTRAGIVPGAIAWDAPDCGALYVSWTQTYLSDAMPHTQPEPFGGCDPALEVTEFTIQVTRCSPSGDTSRAAVAVDPLQTQARQLALDSQQMLDAVLALLCSLTDPPESVSSYLLGPVLPVGPEGGIVAAEMNVAVGLTR
jgi:hypothetical protein